MTPEQRHIAMSSHACDQANELQDLRNRLNAAGDSLSGIPVRATELSRHAGAQTFGLYLDRADADQAITRSPCRDLRTHDLVRRDDVADVVANLQEQAAFTERHLAVISGVLGSPEPLQIDDIAARLHLLIAECDQARADLARAQEQAQHEVAAERERRHVLAEPFREYLYRVASQVSLEHAQWANEHGDALLDALKA